MRNQKYITFSCILLVILPTLCLGECTCDADDGDVNKGEALKYKLAAIFSIFLFSVMGMCIPMLGRIVPSLGPEKDLFFVLKAFAAGVILATGFIHVLPDAFENLTSPCLKEHPWGDFPFTGFVAMLAAIATLMVDSHATSHFMKSHPPHKQGDKPNDKQKNKGGVEGVEEGLENKVDSHATSHFMKSHPPHKQGDKPDDKQKNKGGVESVEQGLENKVDSHATSHFMKPYPPHKQGDKPADKLKNTGGVEGGEQGLENKGGVEGGEQGLKTKGDVEGGERSGLVVPVHVHGSHTHAVDVGSAEHELLRNRVISQVLELGIIVHSVIIGIALGASESPSTIKPLVAALSFHQFFEGIGLGGCVIQAKFKTSVVVIMTLFFSLTTSTGIAIGIGISNGYKENSPTALIVQGIFDSASAGILIYMALVDFLAVDFMNPRMQSNRKLHLMSNASLLCGAGLMSLIAKWA